MYDFVTFLAVITFIAVIVSPLTALAALRRTTRFDNELARLHDRVRVLEAGGRTPSPEPAAAPDAPVREAAPPPPRPEPDQPPSKAPAEEPASWRIAEPPTAQPSQPAAKRQTFEEVVASRWLVWLGSLTIALGGVFLIKYGIENNLLSPPVRVFLGCLLGAGLIAGGEWLRRQPLEREIGSIRPTTVPPALTAAGLAIAFASVYAGYALYGLLPPLIVFTALAVIALVALALSLLQGPFIAAMGILGAFAVPLLVETPAPSAAGLFTYVTFVAVSALAVVRYRNWWWLAGLSLLGSVLWDLVWMGTQWSPGDALPVALHLIATLALFAAPRWEALVGDGDGTPGPLDVTALSPPQALALATGTAVAVLSFVLVRMDAYGGVSLVAFALIAATLAVAAFRLRGLEGLLAVSAVTAVLLLATWHVAQIMQVSLRPLSLADGGYIPPGPIVPPELSVFAATAALIAAGFGLAGFAGLWRARTPVLWATVSTAVPLTVLAVCHWRLRALGIDLAWSVIGLGLAVAATAASSRVARHRERPGMEPALGCYALAVIAALTLAAAITLEKTWLTLALALQLPAAGWVQTRVRIPGLRPVALAIAAAVAVRLVLFHHMPGLPFGAPGSAFWILYGYGLPALAFFLAARWFRKTADDHLVMILESGTIAIAVALISLEIRHFFGEHGAGFWRYALLEQSLQAIAWLATGFGLYRRHRISPRPVAIWGATILIGLAAAQVVVLQVGISNPLFSRVDVGSWLLADKLSLAYLAPAAFALLIHWEAGRQGHGQVASWAGIFVLGLVFVDLTLEVRHLFHGNILAFGPITNAEGYAYSLAWLLYAGALLALGINRRVTALRHASLGLIFLVIGKVFLWDMAALTGLYRVGSFLGLGLSLIAVGYLYQRFVFRPLGKGGDDETETAASP